ncbi:MAG: HEPN domain-containing protein [Mangrovibacterium sp.]
MIPNNDRQVLIQYRLQQAEQTIEEVSKLIENRLFNIAVNRIYYGIFYSLSALALKYEFNSTKHAQLIGWFNKNFIKSGLIDIKYGKILRDAFKNRSDSDYAPFIEFEKNDVVDMQTEIKDFISTLTRFLVNSLE